MIYFVTYAEGRHAVALLLAGWGRALRGRVDLIDYPTLFRRRQLPLGSYIFTGLERLDQNQREDAAKVWAALRAHSEKVTLCNHPLRAMRRYGLLRALRERGLNTFDVYRLDEQRQPTRYPVFLRKADDHRGPASVLLNNAQELAQAVENLLVLGSCLDDWIVTETSELRSADGLYRKYGAFLINGQIIPRHLQVSHDWMVKGNSREISDRTVEEEWAYVNDNTHRDQVKDVFAVANIDYGRVDYTFVDGKLDVFEINTNPQILTPGDSRDEARRPVKRLFAERFNDALGQMAQVDYDGQRVRVDYQRPPLLNRRAQFTELVIRTTNRIGLKRFEPQIYRALVWLRGLWN